MLSSAAAKKDDERMVQRLFSGIEVIEMQHGVQNQRIGSVGLMAPHRIDAEKNHMAFTEFAIHDSRSTG